MTRTSVTLTDLTQFDEIVDARTPSEYAEDHIPGAINCPVLDDEQRAQVGTIYKQVSPFEARRIGGALVAENIARHLKERFADRPKQWKPLVYCWRGGLRSGSFVTWLRFVGWQAAQLEGGYKTWRSHVLRRLDEIPKQLNFRVICGPTGSGKTKLLDALATQGAQVLDLETLAAHRGSVLGALPDQAQPTQKWFDSKLLTQLETFHLERPVFIEAESRKIGAIFLPTTLLEAMRAAPCIALETQRDARIDYLLKDYGWFADQPQELVTKLGYLRGLTDNATLSRWQDWAAACNLPDLFGELIDRHYDPLYARSQNHCYTQYEHASRFELIKLDEKELASVAREILAT